MLRRSGQARDSCDPEVIQHSVGARPAESMVQNDGVNRPGRIAWTLADIQPCKSVPECLSDATLVQSCGGGGEGGGLR